MTDEQLRALIATGETLTMEFKSDRERLSDPELSRNVVCLANAEGGVLVVGVENDGVVTGLHASRARPVTPVQLQAAIFNNTMPPINTRVTVHDLVEGMVVSIEVDAYPAVCATKSPTRGSVRADRARGNDGPWCRSDIRRPAPFRTPAAGL
jgi:ATP-dependent DNA helicase RecG